MNLIEATFLKQHTFRIDFADKLHVPNYLYLNELL